MESGVSRENQWVIEDRERAARRQAQRDAENLARVEEEEKRRDAEQEAKRAAAQAEAEAALKETLRQQFLRHPAASPADFEKSYERLRAAHLEREALGAQDAELAGLRARLGLPGANW